VNAWRWGGGVWVWGVNVCWGGGGGRPAAGITSFEVWVRPAACACFMKINASVNSNDDIMRSGFACWSEATNEVRSVVPTFTHRSATGVTFMSYFFIIDKKVSHMLRP